MVEELLEAWRINNRVNLRLIEGISEEGMKCTLSKRGGRNVIRQLAHLQYVRVHQPRGRTKALGNGARVFSTYEEPERSVLIAALNDSSSRIEEWIRLAAEGAPGVRTMKRGLIPMIAYLIAHESQHRGSILLTLKQCGEPVDRAARDAITDWNTI